MSRRTQARARLDARRTRMLAELDALYAELPAIECRGGCFDSCGVIRMTGVERRRIRAEHDVEIKANSLRDGVGTCSALTVLKRCSVYEIRPMICRIWGLSRGAQCSYGCVPEGGFLTGAQAYTFLARAYEICGEPDEAAALRAVAALPDPERHVRDERRGMRELAELEQNWDRSAW